MTDSARLTHDAGARAVAGAFAVDIVLVVVFALIGRSSHAEELTVAGVWATAWPFLAALVGGWLIAMAWRAPLAPVRTGLAVWVVTVAGGMLLRGVSGQGVSIAFVLVAAIVLGAFFVGWRALLLLVRRRAAVAR
jgi:Protein of unknown function (DUF3054)